MTQHARMAKTILLLMASLLCTALPHAEITNASPFEDDASPVPEQALDQYVRASLQANHLEMAPVCSDAVFIRRAFLDLIGTLPTTQEAEAFLLDTRADKRARIIDELLERPEFTDYASMKWCDLLRVKAEFPINLWPNAVQCYARWIRESLRNHQPYDRFARDLLTASGSNFRVPPANFYRAIQGRTPQAIAGAVALTFMGVRLEKCSKDQQSAMEHFFSRILYKKTEEWKEEIVCLDPAPATPLDTVFPDGTAVKIAPDDDPRLVFADWLLKPENPWFAANITNRVWAWLLGRGIVHEPDDFRADNPPSNPELLKYLEGELRGAHYDLRHLYRVILNSRTYQQSSIPRSTDPKATTLFAYYPVRRLEAEVLLDAIDRIAGSTERYSSEIPEPFSYIPETQRAITLADGSISSPVLELFGRSPRDTGLESERNNQTTDGQRLYLLNATELHKKMNSSQELRRLFKKHQGNPQELIRLIYLRVLSRVPTRVEETTAEGHAYFWAESPEAAAEDLVWALINTKEFLYRH